jgi:hypothetical protein
VILSAISDASSPASGPRRPPADRVVGFQMINPSTGQLDRVRSDGICGSGSPRQINRIPPAASAFLEALQDPHHRRQDHYDLPTFSFAIATMNPSSWAGHVPIVGAATVGSRHRQHRLPAAREEEKPVTRLQAVRLNLLMTKQCIIELRARINQQVFLMIASASISAWSPRRGRSTDTDWHPFAVGAGRARCHLRVAARDHLLSRRARCGRCAARTRRSVSGRHPGSCAVRAGHRIWLGPTPLRMG